ncbi:DUF2092 domain-containing protein [Microvirga aerophila]|uniref:DUF2092 domain-containing protein n=1 Tax=Microvirga aerophila TaxID=670291 RepID=A0A512C066_9HYPH|nr:DUF2092 domain-containing protein [Microvirga aerophila]GEO17606.1 hypothetical protein MAE02_53020 [Microvirga aerophila]
MRQTLPSFTSRRAAPWAGAALVAVAVLAPASLPARADDASALRILKTMSDYMAGQKNLSVRYDADIEVITPDLQKIQFAASGDVLIDRQVGLRATRTGGYADVELIFDGKTVTLHNRDGKTFVTLDAPGTLDDLVQRLRTEHLVEVPGADLLLARSYEQLTEGVLDAKYVGLGVIDGVECEHLAFRNPDTDWQLWVEVGERPIPRKYVITSKAVAQAPQYTLRIKELRTDVKPDQNAFVFKAPEGTKQVAYDALGDIDEVPPGTPAGGSKP